MGRDCSQISNVHNCPQTKKPNSMLRGLRVGFVFAWQFFAAEDAAITYACIQVKAGSLEAYTADDAVIEA